MRKLLLAATALGSAASLTAAGPAQDAPRTIRLNQVGILLDGPKRAMLPSLSRKPLPWRLVDAQGRVVASGVTRVFGQDAGSGEHVHRIDFSKVARTGEGFRLLAAGTESRSFAIGASYAPLARDALAYFYHNRAGTPILAAHVGPQWARPAGHVGETAICFGGKHDKGADWPSCGYSLDVAGGWYDAGDHGKYVVNGGIALWTLQDLAERKAGALFADGAARIPEAGNRISDLLDETRWEMQFLLKMQVPEGTRMRLPVGQKKSGPGLRFTEVDASGMAHHKVGDEKWTALPMAPHNDPEKRMLFPPSTGATLNLAATAAQCARLWKGIDPAFAARCLAAAERAYAAALRNPEIYAVAEFTGSGAYGDSDVSDEFYWAAAELLKTTGKAQYRDAVRRSPHFKRPRASEFGWPTTDTLGSLALVTADAGLTASETAALRRSLLSAADAWAADTGKTGYVLPYASAKWPWGSTSSILNRAMVLAVAHDLTGNAKYRDAVIDGMDFLLGRNPLDRSFVTGYGARPMKNPHHRFWARQLDPKFPPPPPGALSGGPNNSSLGKGAAEKIGGPCAPQTCWVDDIHEFTVNEVAVNWNAPLVWVSAWLAQPES
ncbi:MAG TPA: glycoside hydrolase family 9 protein [Allosphingosinicella sp.]|jgi:endoglucanase